MVIDLFNFNDYVKDKEKYESEKAQVKEMLLLDFSIRKSMVTLVIGDYRGEHSIGFVLLNMILFAPFVGNNISVSFDDLFNEEDLTADALENHVNKIVDRFKEANISYENVRYGIASLLNEASDISGDLNVKAGHGLSYLGFLKVMNTDREAYEMFHPTINSGQFSDIEKQSNKLGKTIINYFKEHSDTELHPYVASETGINKKQLTQFLGFVGLKPDIDGSVIPVAIQDNFLNGLTKLESYYINSKGTRQALITNYKMVRRSGYLTRKLSLSMIDRFHDDNILDCGTNYFVLYSVDNAKKLAQIEGRHYYVLDDTGHKTDDDLLTVKKTDTHLIGTKIGLRSPVTCCGKHVCATCYGRELSRINKDINTGLTAVLKLTEPITQRLLSAKHLLTTNTDKVEWDDVFKTYFYVNMNNVYFNSDNISISFNAPTNDDFDEEEDMFYIRQFVIKINGERKEHTIDSPVKLFINPKILDKATSDEIIASASMLDEEEYIFKYQTKNNVLSKSLQQVIDLIESSSHLGISEYNAFVNKFDDLLIENGLDYIKSVHIEMITSNLIRNADTGKRLDFSKDILDPYVINRISKSVITAPISVSMSFERINDQLVDLNTYEKTESSLMDYLFR